MANQLTTRARAEAYRRDRLRATPAPPRPRPARTLTERQQRWLALLLGALLAGVLGAALWPDGQSRPLSYSQPEPAVTAGSSAPAYAF